ncbi:MAG TPA: hypothetical protein VFW94_23495 [Candidatus Acidoferrales bacterium]|nr:hypothetical protein [Candidatus Acidoferrales bacterium]
MAAMDEAKPNPEFTPPPAPGIVYAALVLLLAIFAALGWLVVSPLVN